MSLTTKITLNANQLKPITSRLNTLKDLEALSRSGACANYFDILTQTVGAIGELDEANYECHPFDYPTQPSPLGDFVEKLTQNLRQKFDFNHDPDNKKPTSNARLHTTKHPGEGSRAQVSLEIIAAITPRHIVHTDIICPIGASLFNSAPSTKDGFKNIYSLLNLIGTPDNFRAEIELEGQAAPTGIDPILGVLVDTIVEVAGDKYKETYPSDTKSTFLRVGDNVKIKCEGRTGVVKSIDPNANIATLAVSGRALKYRYDDLERI